MLIVITWFELVVNVRKLLFFTNDDAASQEIFVAGKVFQPSLVFVSYPDWRTVWFKRPFIFSYVTSAPNKLVLH